ncbi:MAG TPA: hypothetical protein VK737_05725, partial [Opitutales bacterium]|nr:hypothetical protein [Opitutales bacterium]
PWTKWDPEGLADNGTADTGDDYGHAPTLGQLYSQLLFNPEVQNDPSKLANVDPQKAPDVVTAGTAVLGAAAQAVVMGQPVPSSGASAESVALGGSGISVVSKAPSLSTRAADAVVDFFGFLGLGEGTAIDNTAAAERNAEERTYSAPYGNRGKSPPAMACFVKSFRPPYPFSEVKLQ